MLGPAIQLKHRRHWGHGIYYRDNNLIQIKPQPTSLSLNRLTITVDGTALIQAQAGLARVSEKELTPGRFVEIKKHSGGKAQRLS